jgi:hypothetical protein
MRFTRNIIGHPGRAAQFSLLLIFVLTALLFQIVAGNTPMQFSGFVDLTPNVLISSRCIAGLADSPPFSNLSIVTAYPRLKDSADAGCVIEKLRAEGDVLDLEYRFVPLSIDSSSSARLGQDGSSSSAASSLRADKKLAIEVKTGEKLLAAIEPARSANRLKLDTKWRRFSLVLPEGSSMLQIELINMAPAVSVGGNTKSATVQLRTRASFYKQSHALREASERLRQEPCVSVITLGLALAMIAALFIAAQTLGARLPLKKLGLLCSFLIVGLLVHFRPGLSFTFDEWYLLSRIANEGLGAIFIAHNEHFIPVAVTLYAIEYTVFRDFYSGYVIGSIFIHALAAYQVTALLSRLLNKFPNPEVTAIALGGLYLINGLHAEAVQWCMCQGTLLASLFSILALRTCWDYVAVRSSLKPPLVYATLALFSFAGAFTLALQLAVCGMLASRCNAELDLRGRCMPLAKLLSAAALVFALALVCYRQARDAGGLRFSEPVIAAPQKLFAYVAGGSQFGTVFRGLGLATHVEHETVTKTFSKQTRKSWGPEVVAAALGGAISFSILIYYLLSSLRRERVLLWVAGEIFLTLPFMITAIARAEHFGADYAIRSLRYQTPAVLGLVLMLAPLVNDLLKYLLSRVAWRAALATIVLCAHVTAQLKFVCNFDTFRNIGALTRSYLAQLEDWHRSAGNTYNPSFELAVSAGNFPILYKGRERPEAAITDLHPAEISAVLFK